MSLASTKIDQLKLFYRQLLRNQEQELEIPASGLLKKNDLAQGTNFGELLATNLAPEVKDVSDKLDTPALDFVIGTIRGFIKFIAEMFSDTNGSHTLNRSSISDRLSQQPAILQDIRSSLAKLNESLPRQPRL